MRVTGTVRYQTEAPVSAPTASHAGLVILIPNVDSEMQQRLFTGALEQLAHHGEPINQVPEVDLVGEEATFTV